MAFAKELSVWGLFGGLDHQLTFRTAERVTILAGPNGSGKTHLLKILSGLAGLDFQSIMPLPFHSASVKFDNGTSLSVTREDAFETSLSIEARLANGQRHKGPLNIKSALSSHLPDFIERIGTNLWIDSRDGEELTDREVATRFDVSLTLTVDEVIEHLPWLEPFRPASTPTLILTGRLETSIPVPPRHAGGGRLAFRPGRPAAASRIASYTGRISDLINEARRASLATSQMADRQFASRALDRARATVQEAELRRRYEEVSDLHHALHRNGLTEETIGVAFPQGRMNPTERRILNLFLDDWAEKLAPLMPVHEKIELWRSVVAGKLINKDIRVDPRGEISFRSLTGDLIPVELLSSGEQHLVALYTMLLFAADSQAMVLIDEPEISLHAAWKHAFLDDISRIALINDLQLVLATHSTAIVNGRWELVEELTLPVSE